jgi:hypothetical protein
VQVLLLAIGLLMTGHAVLTPMLMVIVMITGDFLSMSLTTDQRPAIGRAELVADRPDHQCSRRSGRVLSGILHGRSAGGNLQAEA